MTKEDLTKEIEAAFSEEIYPGDSNIVYDNSGSHLECEEIKGIFNRKLWQSLTPDFIFEQRYSLSFFSHQGFKYYLPAFLIFASNNFYDADDLNDNLILKMTLPIELDVVTMANAIKVYKIDEQMPNIDFEEILQNQLKYRNQDVHNFIARFSTLTLSQGKAVKHYLEFIQHEYPDEYTQNELATAIERYWFQFD